MKYPDPTNATPPAAGGRQGGKWDGLSDAGNIPKSLPEVDLGDNSAASQRARILRWLMTVGPLSTIQARRHLDILHPGARVMELRRAGRKIITYWTYEETQRGRRHRVARYVLLSGDQRVAA